MPTKNRKFGDFGENLAANFLQKKGFFLLEKNFLTRGGEIDLIFEKDKKIIFVEVKTRKNENFGHPLENISPAKIEKMKIAAFAFLEKNNFQNRDFRFDAITILRGKIEHFENIADF